MATGMKKITDPAPHTNTDASRRDGEPEGSGMKCEEPGCVNGWVVERSRFARSRFAVLIGDRIMRPCPSCNGTGQQSCCEGMVGCSGDVTNQGAVNPIATDKGAS